MSLLRRRRTKDSSSPLLDNEERSRVTYTFSLPAHVYFRTDSDGDVIGLSIMPLDQDPQFFTTSDDFDSEEHVFPSAVRAKAEKKNWFFSPLGHLPHGVTWEA